MYVAPVKHHLLNHINTSLYQYIKHMYHKNTEIHKLM